MTQLAGARSDRGRTVATVLDRLTPESRARLAAHSATTTWPAGAMLLREGQDTPFLGVVEAGRVALRLRIPERGRRPTIVTIEAGELLGWSAVVAPYRATVDAIATEPTRVLTFDARDLRDLLASDCALAAEVLPLVLESVSRRLTASWDQLIDTLTEGTEPW